MRKIFDLLVTILLVVLTITAIIQHGKIKTLEGRLFEVAKVTNEMAYFTEHLQKIFPPKPVTGIRLKVN
jgi:hypothetical protein